MREQGEQGEQREAASSSSLERSAKFQSVDLSLDARSPLLPGMEERWQSTLHWQPSAQQQMQFQQLYAFTLVGNRQFNLTRITEPEEFWEKHLWDSLRGVRRFLEGEGREAEGRRQEAGNVVDSTSEAGGNDVREAEFVHNALETQNSNLSGAAAQSKTQSLKLKTQNSFKVIDIGTGAGFPGLPVAIAQPSWAITLLDATRKKITFIDQVIAQLELTNATTLVERVEQVGRQRHQRETYNLALIRAVAAAPICAEYALPLLKIGGLAVLYRGQWTEAETAALESAVAILGGKIDAIEAFTTPLTQGDRHCIYVKKVASTPNEFPRAIGIPTQKPLGS